MGNTPSGVHGGGHDLTLRLPNNTRRAPTNDLSGNPHYYRVRRRSAAAANAAAPIDEEALEANEDDLLLPPPPPVAAGRRRHNPLLTAGKNDVHSPEGGPEYTVNAINDRCLGKGPSGHGTSPTPPPPPSSSSFPPPPISSSSLVPPPRSRPRAVTVGTREGLKLLRESYNIIQHLQVPSSRLVPTVFKWPNGPGGPGRVQLAGSFNNWTPLAMNGGPAGASSRTWCVIVDLPEGRHQYKFCVDGKWTHNHRQRTVDDGRGGLNNVIEVRESDFEVFDALDTDHRDTVSKKSRKKQASSVQDPPDGSGYSQVIPARLAGGGDHSADGSASTLSSSPPTPPGSPPLLPPHLLQVMLNKETPLSCEPTLLPEPEHHVMLNHLYALSIKDRVMVMSTTQRFREKYVTTVLYKPIQDLL